MLNANQSIADMLEQIHTETHVFENYLNGMGIVANKSCNCPIHDSTGTESKGKTFKYESGRSIAQCYSDHCSFDYGFEGQRASRNFDIVDMIRFNENMEFHEALKKACELCNIEYTLTGVHGTYKEYRAIKKPEKRIPVIFDRVEYKEKPTSIEAAAIQNRLKKKSDEMLSLSELKDKLLNGVTVRQGITQTLFDESQKKDVLIFKKQYLLFVDVDNESHKKDENNSTIALLTEDLLTPEKAIEIYKSYNLKPFLVYRTFSDSKVEYDKFRICFCLDEGIDAREGQNERLRMQMQILKPLKKWCELTAVDTATIDDTRLFFGTNNKEPILFDVNNVICKSILQTLFDELEPGTETLPENKTDLSRKTDISDANIPFICSDKGQIINDLRNYEIALNEISIFKGKIRYNEFSRKIMIYGSFPWMKGECNIKEWNETDTNQALKILCNYGLKNANNLERAIDIVAHDNTINPLCDFLESLEYKGNGYIRRLLPDYMGCEDNDYNYECMKLLMLGMVTRAYKNGCKFDHVLTLQGKQGAGKSTFFKVLAMDDAWFTDNIESFNDRKIVGERIQGKWLAEIPEMSAMNKSEIESIKAIITSTCDSYREAYGKTNRDFSRITVFVGTTNAKTFLKDATGNRRFLIVRINEKKATKSLFDKNCRTDFMNAWAEALHIYNEAAEKGEVISLILPEQVRNMALEYQELANEYEELTGIISCWLSSNVSKNIIYTNALDIWANCLNKGLVIPKSETRRINTILDNLDGWEKCNSVRINRVNEFGIPFNYHGRGYKFVNIVNQENVYKDDFRPVENEDNIPFDG